MVSAAVNAVNRRSLQVQHHRGGGCPLATTLRTNLSSIILSQHAQVRRGSYRKPPPSLRRVNGEHPNSETITDPVTFRRSKVGMPEVLTAAAKADSRCLHPWLRPPGPCCKGWRRILALKRLALRRTRAPAPPIEKIYIYITSASTCCTSTGNYRRSYNLQSSPIASPVSITPVSITLRLVR